MPSYWGGAINAWGTDTYKTVLTLDCATPAPTGSTSTALSAASDVATFLNSAAGLSDAENKITCSAKSGDVYKGKGSGGGDIPQQCIKVGKASGGGSFTFTIPDSYDQIDRVEITCYGWKTTSSISINSGTAQTFTTAQSITTKTFDLSSSSRTITIAVTTSAVCATEVVLKSKVTSATALSVKTAPTKTNYKVGEKLNLAGLVLDATVGGKHVDVTSGYTAKIGETAVTSGTTTLSEVGAKTITFTYGGQTATQTIHVGTLKSIAITTEPTKTEYNQGQTFDPSGMVVKATFSDGEDTPTEWTETLSQGDGGYSYSPSASLGTSNTTITVSYTWNNVEKTTTQTITVNAATAYTVTFNAGTGSCGTTSLTEASGLAGVTLPTATISVTGWSFAGWAAASTTNTTTAPTLYAASSTYHPTENCTLYAVYKYADASSYKRATSVNDITSASYAVIVSNANSYILNHSLSTSTSAPTESENKITAPTNAIFTLSGDNTNGFTLTCSGGTIGATTMATSGSGNTSKDISLTTTNNKWIVETSSSGTNTFAFRNAGSTYAALDYYNGWKLYYNTSYSSNTNVAMKVYVPIIAYNSNPAAIVNPAIAWTTAGNKSLYLQDETSYTNAATYTSGSSIGKTIAYSSSDATVASVTSAGVVTALKAGTTTITAKVEKEVGVNTEAKVTYTVTVKDAKTIAGLKAITDASSVVTFSADLTDAIVTYVNGSHAYIQDASGAVYASCGSSLTAGKKINGAVSGSIKAAYKIDEITAIDLSDATLTDADIPAVLSKTVAQLIASTTTLEGQLVQVSGATVTASLASGSASGGKITDDAKVSEINLYAPGSNVEALKDAEGTFKGFISYYNGSSYRLNIYEQSQITLTKNAPTDQALSFESDAVELDEATDAYTSFNGQAVSGAKGTVTYSIDSNEDGVVASINASTGAVVLSGNIGTATIKASAAAAEETVAGVTTPWKATTETYTITVRPRYTSTFSILGTEYAVRQASYGATITLPTPAATIGQYAFIGWTSSAMAVASDTKPTIVTPSTTPTSSSTFYAVYAVAAEGEFVEHTSTFTIKQSSSPSSPYVSDGSSWTWSSVTFANAANACIQKSSGTVTFTLPSGGKAKSLKITKTSNAWAGAAEVVLKDASNNSLNTFSLGSNASATYDFTSTDNQSSYYTLTNGTTSNAWVDNIVFKYEKKATTYSSYCTTIPSITLSLTADTWATYCFPMDVTIPSGVTVYEAKLNNDKTAIVATALETNVPKGAGVLLKPSSTGSFAFAEANESVSALSDNELKGTLVQVTAASLKDNESDYVMVLKKNDNKFIHYTGTNFPANRACLIVAEEDVPQSQETAGLRIVFEENNATSLESVEASDEAVKFFENGQLFIRRAGKVYDVTGRLVK